MNNAFLISAELKLPDNLPQYKKNAYRIFHQLLQKMDDLITEQNHLKLQMASIFTSIEQVEIQKRGENETIEEYNRHKALANLTKMRFMKQMEKLTKNLKEDTELTNLRPMPKPTKENILTKKISTDIPNNILIPNIENNVEDELKRLGLNTKILTIRKEKLKRKPTLVSLTDSSASSVPGTQKQVKTTTQTTQKMDENLHLIKSLSEDKPIPVLEPEIKLQRSPHYTAADALKLPKRKQDEYSPQEEKNADHTAVTQEKENNHHEENKDETEQKKERKQRRNFRKLTREEHKKAYPWAHEASKKYNMKTPFAEEVEYFRHTDIGNKLTSNMKKRMMTAIVLPDEVIKEIDHKIEEIDNGSEFRCTICSKSFKQHYYAQRHVKTELGYCDYRCSFCNVVSNTPRIIYNHYAMSHGVPQQWITS